MVETVAVERSLPTRWERREQKKRKRMKVSGRGLKQIWQKAVEDYRTPKDDFILGEDSVGDHPDEKSLAAVKEWFANHW